MTQATCFQHPEVEFGACLQQLHPGVRSQEHQLPCSGADLFPFVTRPVLPDSACRGGLVPQHSAQSINPEGSVVEVEQTVLSYFDVGTSPGLYLMAIGEYSSESLLHPPPVKDLFLH